MELIIAVIIVAIGAIINFFGKNIYVAVKKEEVTEKNLFKIKMTGFLLIVVGAIITCIVRM